MNVNDLSNYRKVYKKSELSKNEVPENPMELFQKWFFEVEEFGGDIEANAMTISTIDSNSIPQNRVVLLKKYTWEGFIFYTNYDSNKGKAIAKNPNVCLSFFWHNIERQVIIKGSAEKISENLSDGYFESRPDGSKLGAWASNQSEVVPSREFLDNRLANYEEKFKDQEIPRPKNWGGYIVKPMSIEFWQGRPNRMHDRIKYTLQENYDWKIERLAP
ncbi:MAG: pyridoxamine 5'-phosphate oxidase [Lutibacter sp.]|uniref:pyridoxamine 5'-phosphate oxidase n=1 Tax=Lutibacter sp. TaxID=1925666 RepID=UPI00183594E6|nr:pyridoxamine 5'-phosphate oxidase [Lutibacter sp.]MBT8317431.1 pyridoxamine 5'-phosphate oxidase [Lutibacter sp.]NNJ58290.1 pyridoxamine 5'-phosphate oxidase [Lutibacter sp.]